MGEANLAICHCRRALVQLRRLPADADSISGSSTAEVAVGFDPCDRAVEALPVVLIGLSELSREDRELELVLIDLLAPADQLNTDLLASPGCNSPHPTLHTEIVRTNVWVVKKSWC